MVSRSNNNGLNLKPTVSSLGKICRNILLIFRQMWYVPFFWSLTWFLYWLIRDILILKMSIIDVNPFHYAGMGISVSVLLLAKSRLGTGVREKAIFLGTRFGTNIKKVFFHARFSHKNNTGLSAVHSEIEKGVRSIQMEKNEPKKLQIKYQSSVVRNETEGSKGVAEKLTKPQPFATGITSSFNYSIESQASNEISSECLTCANLISCNHRRYESGKSQGHDLRSNKCPFAQELSGNETALA